MKLQSIQLLRGVAALLVVSYHAWSLQVLTAGQQADGRSLLEGFYTSGYAGVDLFFVISGFIMVWVTQRETPGPAATGEFLFARVTRIYPLWWATALAATLYYLFIHVPDANDPAWRAALKEGGGGEFLVKSFLLIPQQEFPVLSLGWTLIHEVYFYSVFALLLLLPRAALPVALLAWGAMIIAASFAGLTAGNVRDFLTLIVHPLTMEFIFGAIVGLMLSSGFSARSGLITLGAAIWFTAMVCYQGPPEEITFQWGRVLSFGLPAAALVYGMAALEQHGRLVWLVPIGAAVITCCAVFQFQGVTATSEESLRRSAALWAAGAGLAGGGLVIGLGWLGGKFAPDALYRLSGPLAWLFKACARTGDWSYSIYLSHIFVVGACLFALQWQSGQSGFGAGLQPGAQGIADDLVYIGAVFVGALVVGWLGYTLVERPALILFGWMRRRLFPASRRARRA